MTITQLFKPHPLLQPLIQMVMVKGVAPWEGATKKVYTYPPTPINCIILYLGNPIRARKLNQDTFERQSRCVVVGPQLTSVDIEVSKDHRAVLIGFQPGGLFRFLGIPMTEMFDDGIDGFDILDKEISWLIDIVSHRSMSLFLLGFQDDLWFQEPKSVKTLKTGCIPV